MPSLTERAVQIIGPENWNAANAERIQQVIAQLQAQDQAAYDASKRKWKGVDRAAMAATLALMGAGVGSAIGGAGGASASASGGLPPAFATEGIGFDAAPLASTIGAGGAGAGAAAAGAATKGGRGLLGGLTARDLAAIGLAGASTIGAATAPKPDLKPTTQTTDPNLLKWIQSMQGRLDQSEPLYKSVLSMANGLLPTQYQNGGQGG